VGEADYLPRVCVWELTLRCNMRCLHCGSSAGRARPNELTVGECLRVADQLLELGCTQTTFIGGEVLLYKGWQRVARRLWDGGCAVNLITNAFVFGDAQVRQVREARVANVGVSVDGMRESHDRIRNVRGAFDRALAAIARLRDEGIATGVVTSLVDFNAGDLEPLHELLVRNGVGVWQLQIVTAMGNVASRPGFLLDPSKVPQITRFIRQKREEGRVLVYAGDDIGYFDEHEFCLRSDPGTLSAWQGCQAGLRAVGIDSVGNVKGCESLYDERFIEGNLRETPLRDLWFREGAFAYNRQFDPSLLEGSCAGCDKGPICRGGCRGMCYFTTGSLYDNRYCCYPGKPQRREPITSRLGRPPGPPGARRSGRGSAGTRSTRRRPG